MNKSNYPHGVRDVLEIFRANDKFEYQMAFIPKYNQASTEDQIRFCHIMIEKCAGRTTKEALNVKKSYLEKFIVAMNNKIKRDHCG